MASMKILIVDDETPISSYLERKLSKLGYEVMVAEDGEQAVSKAEEFAPDLVLLDVKLPKLNGIQVCERLRSKERFKNTRIFILSAKAQSEEIKSGLDAGANKYLCKPISFPDILAEIEQA